MGTGDARHGRRDNGLVAAEYAAVGDVDPRVGEHLLDVLGLEGIAAYLRPSTDLHPVTRQNSLPARPTDRLYVDRTHLPKAREYLTRLAAEAETDETAGDDQTDRPEPVRDVDPPGGPTSATDIDDAWAKIVAGFNDDPTTSPSWPAAENLSDRDDADRAIGGGQPDGTENPTGRDRLPRDGAPVTPPTPEPEQPSLLDGLDTFGANLPDEDEDGYTPPTPPPMPRPSLPTVLGVVGVVGGLITFLKPSLLPISPSTAMVVGFLAIMAGFGTLVWRLRPGDDDDDVDPTNGARV